MVPQNILCKNTAPGIKSRFPFIHPLIQQTYIEHLIYASPAGRRGTVVSKRNTLWNVYFSQVSPNQS